jgi:hypothetical protein
MTTTPESDHKMPAAGPPILRVSYGLTLHLHQRVQSFPRAHRYSIGQALTERSLALTTALVATNAATNLQGCLAELHTAGLALCPAARIALEEYPPRFVAFRYSERLLQVVRQHCCGHLRVGGQGFGKHW